MEGKESQKPSVFISSKNVLGEYYWWNTCSTILRRRANLDGTIVYEDKQYIYTVNTERYTDSNGGGIGIDNPGKYTLYKVNKSDFSISVVKEQSFENDANQTILRNFLGEYSENWLFF